MELCSYFMIAMAQKYYNIGYVCCFIHILLTKNCITIMQDIRNKKTDHEGSKKPLFSSHDVKVYDRKGSFTNICRRIGSMMLISYFLP